MDDGAPISLGDSNTIQQESFSSPCSSPSLKKIRLENQVLKSKIQQLEKIMSQTSFNTVHVKALVEPFSGNDTLTVHKWIEKLENAFRVLNLNELQQLIATCELLTGTAAVFRKGIPLTGYDDLKTKLLEEFGGKKLSNADIANELRAHQLGDKCLLRYVMEMVEIAQCNDISEEDLVDIIIDGFQDNSCAVVMLYGVKTIAELKSLLPRYEKRLEINGMKKQRYR